MLACFVHLGEQVTLQAAREADPRVRDYALENNALSRIGFEHDALSGIREALMMEIEKAREFVEAS